ncbi:MAG TPA: hypothetical protein G4O20_00640 [Dehalococcoidia bacterium]|nr:hypothetical protein [Dehalococcoidia bacterium]
MRNIRRYLRALTVFILLISALLPFSLASAQEVTEVSVSAPGEVNSGEQFTVDIVVNPATAIAGVQFDLAFDPSLVTVDSVAEGDLLSQNGASTYFSPGTTDNVAGTVTGVAGAITTPGQVVSTAGTFATITMTAGDGGGTCTLTLSEVVVGDIDGQSVPVSVVSGQVIINQTSPPSTGGGGSGGGGGGGGGAPGFTPVMDYTTLDGKFTDDITAESVDGRVALYIAENTIGLNRYGSRLRSITIMKSDSYPEPPENYIIIPPVYHITPDGATFEPPVDLTIEYDGSLVPGLLAKKNLVVATCDTSNNEWEILESIVDSEKGTIKGKVSHFSLFAVLAPTHPAHFVITSLSVAPGEVYPGDEVSISAIVTNTGSLTGTQKISLVVDAEIAETREVTLDGGDNALVNFTLTADTVGKHLVELGELQNTFTVNEPEASTEFITSNLEIDPIEVTTGESVTISVLVSNTGDLPGSYEVSLLIDEYVVQTEEIALNGGDSEHVSFQVPTDTAGEYKVTIDGLSGSYVVKAPFAIEDETNENLEMNIFDVVPLYNPDNGKLVAAKIVYELNKGYDVISEEQLRLNVFREEVLLEVIPLLKLSQIQPDGKTGEVYYVPSQGWQAGTYSFQAEYGTEGEGLIQLTQQEYLNVTPEQTTKIVSWATLLLLIGFGLIAAVVTLAIVLFRRRDMLRS